MAETTEQAASAADTTREQIAQKEQEIADLRCAFAHPGSEIADDKVARIYEARINAEPDPYSADELIAKRQTARDRIDTLKKEIRKLRGEDEETLSDEEKKARTLNELDTGYERAKKSNPNGLCRGCNGRRHTYTDVAQSATQRARRRLRYTEKGVIPC